MDAMGICMINPPNYGPVFWVSLFANGNESQANLKFLATKFDNFVVDKCSQLSQPPITPEWVMVI